jgi:hypothetical protein
MAERLADRMARCLQLFAGRTVFLPGLRILCLVVTDFSPPGFPVDNLSANYGPRDCNPFAAVIGDRPRGFVVASLRLADLLGHVADIDDAFGIELRPVVEHLDEVGAVAGLDGRSDPRLNCQPIDPFKIELDA